MSLRVFRGDHSHEPSQNSTLQDFFLNWYVPEVTETTERKPTSMSTINSRRRPAVRWWTQLMATKTRPFGPLLCEITSNDLQKFRERLKTATYQRGKRGKVRLLSEIHQQRQVEEIELILNSAGQGKRGAKLIDSPPKIYLSPVPMFPKDTLTMEEARKVAKGLDTFPMTKRWEEAPEVYRLRAKATIAFWFYTGHRKVTFQHTRRGDIIKQRNGGVCLHVRQSVKTSKLDKIAMHPQLVSSLEAWFAVSPGDDTTPLISWPMHMRTLFNHHERWQLHAGISEPLSPQTWRRLHSDEIGATPFKLAQQLASETLGHSTTAITEASYSGTARNLAILSLPNLFED